MFCDHCGAPLQPDYNLCPKCGKQVAQQAVPAKPCFERNLHLLGIFWMIAGAFWLIPSFALMTMSQAVHFGMPMGMPFGNLTHFMFPPVMFGLGSGFLLVAAGGMCVGWGLTRHEPWARVAAIVVGILALFHPPFGTALGIFTLWVLLPNHAAAQYDAVARNQ